MKLVIDQSIPFIKGVFEPYSEVVYRDCIDREDCLDADGLIILSRTKCNESLLSGSAVKMIAIAAIGTDNVDQAYCRANNIFVSNAAGCNAGGTMNYVFSALYGAASRKSVPISGATMGIVGLGQVGTRVEGMARHLGFKVLLNDPPRAMQEGDVQYVPLDYLLANSDIVTMHVPLDAGTKGMADADFFARMKFGAFFINTARGEIVDENALMDALPKLGPVILDTWNNEPNVNAELVKRVDIATPHIAGYSYQGKQRGTASAVRSVARFFKIEALYEFFPPTDVKELEAARLDLSGMTQGQIASVFQYNYPVFTDDFMFRVAPEDFEKLRTNYNYRREYYIK